MEFKRRNNDKVVRKEYFEILQKQIDTLLHPISYDDADYEIVIEVFRDMLIFAVLPGYKRLKKYNLQQLSGIEQEEEVVITKVLTIAEILK
jgi:hypothetical protein